MASLSQQLNKLIIGLFLLIVPIAAAESSYTYYHYDIPPINVTPLQKHMFMHGHTAPYSDQYVERVIVGQARISKRGAIVTLPHPNHLDHITEDFRTKLFEVKLNEDSFKFNNTQSKLIRAAFWTSQILDIYSTKEGMKYSCLREANPLLPEVPEVHEMAGLKLAVFFPVMNFFDGDRHSQDTWMLGAASLTSIVVVNNFRLLNKAKNKCTKR